MALKINEDADPDVLIPVCFGQLVSVGALLDVDHKWLAQAVGLSDEQFETNIREWASGEGLPYGILIQEEK